MNTTDIEANTSAELNEDNLIKKCLADFRCDMIVEIAKYSGIIWITLIQYKII